MGLSIGLCYELKEDFLRAGFAPEDVLEFDSEDTVAGLQDALIGLGHTVERIGRGGELARRLAQRLDHDALVICGPQERELARGIARHANHSRVFSLAE